MKLKGIRVPHKKHTAASAPQRIPVPKLVTIPMSMHIGRPAKPIVKRGDTVKVGQLIAEADGYISAPVHASVSGKVQKIDEMVTAMGAKVQVVVIEPDGLQEISEEVKPPEVSDLTSFVAAVRNSGSVGLGGAGFPTFVKFSFNNDLSVVDAVVINAAECEPYITSDTRTLLDRADDVFAGIELLKKYLKVPRYVIGIEDNKPDAIAKARALAAKIEGDVSAGRRKGAGLQHARQTHSAGRLAARCGRGRDQRHHAGVYRQIYRNRHAAGRKVPDRGRLRHQRAKERDRADRYADRRRDRERRRLQIGAGKGALRRSHDGHRGA